jgi:inorganic phosphate transporter, PiT family
LGEFVEPVAILLIIAVIAGLYLAFNIGANDVANAMGTSVGSGALTIKKAIIAAATFEFLGAFLFGDEVSRTIKQGFVSPEIFAENPEAFAYGMTAAILATSLWLQYATFRGLPVSTTHSIVGAVLGFALMHGGLSKINFGQLGAIFSTWLISPILGGLISYVSLRLILRFIIDSRDPIKQANRWVPWMIGTAVFILSSTFTAKIAGKIAFSSPEIALVLALFLGLITAKYFQIYLKKDQGFYSGRQEILERTEEIFARMQLLTACFLAFAHGSNDVANAIGPAAAVISALTNNSVSDKTHVPTWLLFIGGIGIVLGLASFGRKVIHTVGKKITEITPTRGFAAEFGAALTILLGSILGLPLSTTHVLVGAVIGVGFARGISGIDVLVIKRIARSWVVTMPFTALISMLFCFILKYF